ncbi:MAG: NarK/NasA family nitrate transporter [Nitrospirae bacterium]|nr:NarK/NasA family nitrate transporter [Nitrospirota bacterium]
MSWLKKWEPEDPQFWKSEGSGRAWGTLAVTTFGLMASFATWFVMSAVVVRLPNIGFKFDTMQLFWLAAMPGLSAGMMRTVHAFLIPILGTRTTVTIANFIKLIPMVWLAYAVQNLETPYIHFLIISFLCGFGGGDFSSYMPSTSLFFPKRLQGTAMGLQAGIGNFGVSLVQFVTPWIVTFGIIGAVGGPQLFTKATPVFDVKIAKDAGVIKDVVVKNEALAKFITVVKNPSGGVQDVVITESDLTKGMKVEIKKNEAGVITDLTVKKIIKKDMWVQNAALWYVPWLIIAGIISFIYLKSIPMRKVSVGTLVKNMTDNKHAYFCVWIYVMTFGSFAGFSAAFPLMIKTIYGAIHGMDPALAPDPLKYAFLGPLIGSTIRFAGGPLSDKFGGAIFTMVSGVGLILGCLALIFGGYLTPTDLNMFPAFVWIMLWIFLMAGIGNFSTFRQFPIAYAFNPRMGSAILGWTGAWAAYGPFIFSSLIGASIAAYGSAKAFFWGALIFYVIGSLLNWVYYTKPGAERGDWGVGKTWWHKLSESERERYIAENP